MSEYKQNGRCESGFAAMPSRLRLLSPNTRHLAECAGEEPKSADNVSARNGNKFRLVRAITSSAPKHEAARMFLSNEHGAKPEVSARHVRADATLTSRKQPMRVRSPHKQVGGAAAMCITPLNCAMRPHTLVLVFG